MRTVEVGSDARSENARFPWSLVLNVDAHQARQVCSKPPQATVEPHFRLWG